MRIYLNAAQSDFGVGVKKRELVRWFLFFFFLENILPFFFDPFNLGIEWLVLPYEDLFDFIVVLIMPYIIMYFGELESVYGYTLSLILYIFMFGVVLDWSFIVEELFHDVLSVIIVCLSIMEFLNISEEEEFD